MTSGSTIVLVRHGAVDSPIGPNGPLIYGPEQPLNTQGQHQMLRLRQQLINEHAIPDVIYTSPFVRAVQSAMILSETLPNHPKVVVKDNLKGADAPQWEMRPVSELAVVGNDMFQDNPRLPFIRGETLPQAEQRVRTALQEIRSQEPEGIVAIVSHAETIGIFQHILKHPDKAAEGWLASIEKGEALYVHLDLEGKMTESRVISPEGPPSNPERRE